VRSNRLAALALLALAAAGPPTREQLHDAERAHAADLAEQRAAAERAQAAAEQAARLADARVAAAVRLRAAEDALAGAAARVAELSQRRAAAAARLASRAAALRPLLPAIERLSLYPAETLLAAPMPPEDAVRGVIVLSGITRALEQEAAALRTEQAEVAALQTQLDAALPGLQAAQAEQRRLAADLDAQIAAARASQQAAEDAAAEAARRAAADAARTESLRSAIVRIEADRRAAEARAREEAAAAERRRQMAAAAAAEARQEALARPAGPGMGEPLRQLATPVAGTLLRGFGAATEAGPASGETYATPPGARVVSPCGGRVVFSGPFRSYGLLLIIDCGGGYHFVLSGLDRLDAAAGQRVEAGEPVGVMAQWDPRSPGERRPTLYVELRKDGEPVNPAPFLRARS
jgi:septal ring factor EnvC (AmiA/AmiB activator)